MLPSIHQQHSYSVYTLQTFTSRCPWYSWNISAFFLYVLSICGPSIHPHQKRCCTHVHNTTSYTWSMVSRHHQTHFHKLACISWQPTHKGNSPSYHRTNSKRTFLTSFETTASWSPHQYRYLPTCSHPRRHSGENSNHTNIAYLENACDRHASIQ